MERQSERSPGYLQLPGHTKNFTLLAPLLTTGVLVLLLPAQALSEPLSLGGPMALSPHTTEYLKGARGFLGPAGWLCAITRRQEPSCFTSGPRSLQG